MLKKHFTLIGSLFLLTIVVGIIWQISNLLSKNKMAEFSLSSNIGEINRLDEILTMSAKLYAATNDMAYLEVYNNSVVQLDQLIKSTIELSNKEEINLLLKSSNEANDQLVAMELESFELVAQQKNSQALKLLSSETYNRYKQQYSSGMNNALAMVFKETRQTSNFFQTALLSIGFSMLLLLFIATYFCFQYLDKKRLNQLLDKNVKQGTQELTLSNQHLQVAKRQAEAANHAKNKFLENISHEVNTPLNGIIGLTQFHLKNGEISEKLRKHLEMIYASGTQLFSIFENVLEMARIETGQVVTAKRRVIVSDIIGNLLDIFANRVINKGLSLEIIIEKNTPDELSTDGVKLQHILAALLNNAIKFTPKGEIQLRVRHQVGANEHIFLVFEVIDEGPGIDPGEHQRVFQAFEQSQSANQNKPSGIGLGLAICKEFSHLLKGELIIMSSQDSNSNKGCHFKLSLPVVANHQATTNSQRLIVKATDQYRHPENLLEKLPLIMVKELYHATIMHDLAKLKELNLQIEQDFADIAISLEQLIANRKLETISSFCQQTMKFYST